MTPINGTIRPPSKNQRYFGPPESDVTHFAGWLAHPEPIKIRRTQHQKSKLDRSSKGRVFRHGFWEVWNIGVALRRTFCLTLRVQHLSHVAHPNMSARLSTYNVPYMITARITLSQTFGFWRWSDEARCQLRPPSESSKQINTGAGRSLCMSEGPHTELCGTKEGCRKSFDVADVCV